MGIDFTAYLGHSMRVEDLAKLVNELNENAAQFSFIQELVEFVAEHNPDDKDVQWRLDTRHFGGTLLIEGPGGISLTFSENVCYFNPFIRWRSFLLDHEIQLKIRNVCYELMNTMNSFFVIYVPDNALKESGIIDYLWDDENKDIFFMREWLLTHCGLPKNRIKEIYKQLVDCWEIDGYYIDDFKDFRPPSPVDNRNT